MRTVLFECNKCGRTIQLFARDYNESTELFEHEGGRKVGSFYGMRVPSSLFGVCEDCKKKDKPNIDPFASLKKGK